MGASGGTSANMNQAANNSANQANNTLNGYASAGSNSGVQSVLGQYANGGMSLNQAIASLGQTAQGPAGGTNGSGQYYQGGSAGTGDTTGASALSGGAGNGTQGSPGTLMQDTSDGTNQGAIDQLFSSPLTGGLAAQNQVENNSLYSGMFGKGGQLQQSGTNLAQDRQALSGNDPSYGLQASDLAAYGQASNNIGRQAAQQNQGIAQSLAARGLGSSNNGAAIGSYAGAYGNQNEALAGLQQTIAQQRIQTAQGLATARNNSDMQQNQYLGNLASSAYNSQLGANETAVQNDYNVNAGNAAAQQQYQTNEQNINNSQFSQAQQTKTAAGGPLGGILTSLGSSGAGALGGSLGNGLGTALGGSSPTAKPAATS